MTGAGNELIGGKIVVHEVGADNQMVLAKLIAEQRMNDVLLVAVVVVVRASAIGQEVGLVVLVEGVGELQMPIVVPVVAALQTCTIGVEMIVVGVSLTGAEEIAAAARQREMVCGTQRQSFFHVVSFLAIEATEVGVVLKNRLVVRQALCLLHQFDSNLFCGMRLRQVNGINAGVLETRLRVPFRVIKRETGTVAPFVAEGVEA